VRGRTMFDRETVRKVLAECDEALKAVAERNGLALVRKHCSFSHTELPVAFKLVAKGEDGALTREAETFRQCAELVGLEPSMLGARFKSNGRIFRITGLNLRAQRFPVLAEDLSGKTFKFPAETVRRLVGAAADLNRQPAEVGGVA